jgi:hypothetical protein
MAAFAVTVPVGASSVATLGSDMPVGQVVRYPSGPGGTALKLNE